MLILLVAGGRFGVVLQANAAEPPATSIIDAPQSAKLGDVVQLNATLPEGAASAWAIVPTADGITLILAYGCSPDTIRIVSRPIGIKRPPTGEEPDDPVINEAVIRAWLEDVPTDAREVAAENPMTGESVSRQANVGRTFRNIGKVAKALGSIRAVNVMLATGLAASYGDGAADWKPFDASARKALAALAAEGATATEYGEALGLIGEVLQ
jgi:hypothetical protein